MSFDLSDMNVRDDTDCEKKSGFDTCLHKLESQPRKLPSQRTIFFLCLYHCICICHTAHDWSHAQRPRCRVLDLPNADNVREAKRRLTFSSFQTAQWVSPTYDLFYCAVILYPFIKKKTLEKSIRAQ